MVAFDAVATGLLRRGVTLRVDGGKVRRDLPVVDEREPKRRRDIGRLRDGEPQSVDANLEGDEAEVFPVPPRLTLLLPAVRLPKDNYGVVSERREVYLQRILVEEVHETIVLLAAGVESDRSVLPPHVGRRAMDFFEGKNLPKEKDVLRPVEVLDVEIAHDRLKDSAAPASAVLVPRRGGTPE